MTISVRHEAATAVVTLDRPSVRNALSSSMIAELQATMARLGADDEVRVIVLTGSDPAFCAGLDLSEVTTSTAILDQVAVPGGLVSDPWLPLATTVIAAVNGPAVTGGLELVLHCDVVIASERAWFGDTHARYGLVPGWGMTVLLPLAVGRSRARLMSLSGHRLSAGDALTAGLVAEVVAHEKLLPRALEIASGIAANPPAAVAELLRIYREVERCDTAPGLDAESAMFTAHLAARTALGDSSIG